MRNSGNEEKTEDWFENDAVESETFDFHPDQIKSVPEFPAFLI